MKLYKYEPMFFWVEKRKLIIKVRKQKISRLNVFLNPDIRALSHFKKIRKRKDFMKELHAMLDAKEVVKPIKHNGKVKNRMPL